MGRAKVLAGRRIDQLARVVGYRSLPDLSRHKGWIGQMFENLLGATAGSRAEPDFPHLGIELKTLPLSPLGKPLESTYVCTLPLDGSLGVHFDGSWVQTKLARVLWVPIVVPPGADVGDRRVGMPFVWSPSAEQRVVLPRDWEHVAQLVATGELWHLTARHGEALQVRPKALRSTDVTRVFNAEGEECMVNPRGFYLRPSFTAGVLAQALRVG